MINMHRELFPLFLLSKSTLKYEEDCIFIDRQEIQKIQANFILVFMAEKLTFNF